MPHATETAARSILDIVLALHGVSVGAATMLMWVVLSLSYPLYAYVPAAAFEAYHAQHCRRITPLAGVVLASQGGTAAVLWWLDPAVLPTTYLVLTCAGVVMTGLLAAPLHTVLGRGFDAAVARRLQRVHLYRTLVWTVHLALVLGHVCTSLPRI